LNPGRSRHLENGMQHLVVVVANCSLGRNWGTRNAIENALNEGVPPARLAEGLLQTYLFAGYPRSINGLVLLRNVLETRSIELTWDPDALEEPDQETAERQGERLFERVYGERADEIKARIVRAHPLMARWMIREGYGRVLSMPGLTEAERELAALASLVALGVTPQAKAHIWGAFRLGATKEAITETIYLAGATSPGPDLSLYLKWAAELQAGPPRRSTSF